MPRTAPAASRVRSRPGWSEWRVMREVDRSPSVARGYESCRRLDDPPGYDKRLGGRTCPEEHHGDVVAPAGGVRELDENLGGRRQRREGLERLGDHLVAHHPGEAVGAREVDVARL